MDIHNSDTIADNAALYETDFYDWCLRTADLVRAGQWDELDPDALAEELESLGKSQKHCIPTTALCFSARRAGTRVF